MNHVSSVNLFQTNEEESLTPIVEIDTTQYKNTKYKFIKKNCSFSTASKSYLKYTDM